MSSGRSPPTRLTNSLLVKQKQVMRDNQQIMIKNEKLVLQVHQFPVLNPKYVISVIGADW